MKRWHLRKYFSRRPTFPSRWPTSTNEKPETDNWDAWAAQPSLTVPSAGQLRQRSAFTPATATGSSPSPVLGQVRAVSGCACVYMLCTAAAHLASAYWPGCLYARGAVGSAGFGSRFPDSIEGPEKSSEEGDLPHRLTREASLGKWHLSGILQWVDFSRK